jgi:hypothetical protein
MASVVVFFRNLRTRLLCRSIHLVSILVAFGLMTAPPSSNAGSPAAGPRCTITPSAPVGVPAGGTYSFTAANCGSAQLTWQVSGPGSIDRSGNYSAPASVEAHSQSRGCQQLPNNAPFNVAVDQLPVDSHSSRWLTRIAQDHPEYLNTYHALKFYTQILSQYDNVVDNNTPQERMHFLYGDRSNGYQDASFPIPAQRDLLMEGGASVDAAGWVDRHLFTINKTTCEDTEIYNLYADFRTVTFTPGNPTRVSWTTNTVWPIPQGYQVFIAGGTGAWAAANSTWRLTVTGSNTGTLPFNSSGWGSPSQSITMGATPYSASCPTCNSQGGQKYRPNSYAMLGGTDAASMPMSALALKLEEWYAATRAGRDDLGHAIRTTMSNSYLAARAIWPAAGVANTQWILTNATNGSNPTFTALSDFSGMKACNNYTYTAGCQFHVVIFGLTGAWAAANGDQTAVAVDSTHFSVPALNTTSWGRFTSGYGVYFVPDFMPYGATIRLKASFDVDNVCTSTDLNNWCPYAKVYLNTLKKYGMVVADGTTPGDNWDNTTISSEFHPKVLVDATTNLRASTALQPIEQSLEVVNRSSQQLSNNLNTWLMTNSNRTVVQVCGSAGCATNDVILQGTTIGTDRERLTMGAGASYRLNTWVNGNADHHLVYSMDSGISGAYVSSAGAVTNALLPDQAARHDYGVVAGRSRGVAALYRGDLPADGARRWLSAGAGQLQRRLHRLDRQGVVGKLGQHGLQQ